MRTQLPGKIGGLYTELRDEIITAFDDKGDVFSVTEYNALG